MSKGIDPFTRTPGIAGQAYIETGISEEIIANFTSDVSSKYVYKITGLRGSGKSVEYGNVIRTIRELDDWLVYPLSASGDVVSTLIAKISEEQYFDNRNVTTSIQSSTSITGNMAVISGGETIDVNKTYSVNDKVFSEEAYLTKLIKELSDKDIKVLVGIDDIAKTKDTIHLLSMIGSMIIEGLNIYLIVTGLSENIEDFSSEKNLTFFKRADSIEIRALNKFDITYMYEKLLDINADEARRIEKISKGYAYAYQVLGSLYFKKGDNEKLEDIMPDFDRIMFKDSYDLIWKSLTKGEKELINCIYRTKDGKAEDIKSQMNNPSSYPVYRERLINKHIVDGSNRGYLTINLPRFKEFVEIWGEE